MSAGRNEPCPCGSGKKYKKCCLSNAPPRLGYTRDERASALSNLDRFIADRLGPDNDAGLDEAWGSWADSDEQLPPGHDESSEHVCDLWFAFDRPLADGRLPVDRFLAERARSASPGEARYLEALKRSSMHLYEVEAVRPGDSLTLRDVMEGEVVTVQERSGSRAIGRGEWLATRVVPGASGRLELEGLLRFPPLAQKPLREKLAAERAAYLEANPGASLDPLYKRLAPALHQLWLGCIFEPLVPSLANTDGEELVLTRVSFEVLDAPALERALDSAPGLKRGPHEQGVWHWAGANQKGGDVSLGLLTSKAGVLTLEANSIARAARGRALVEAAAGAAVRHRATTHEDLQTAMREALKSGAPSEPAPEDSLPFEVQEALVLDHMARHYHGWLDEQIPALDGRTPREAAPDKELRPKLVELLKGLDAMYQHALRAGAPAFDGSWLWDELFPDEARAAHPPPLAHERLAQLVPGSGELVAQVAESLRRAPDFDDATSAVSAETLRDNLDAQRFLRQAPPLPPSSQPLEQHLSLALGFALHRKKAFWVDPPLAYMLARTELDARGEELRSPFPSFAVVFTDRHVLSLAERLLARQEGSPVAGHFLGVLTVFVTERHRGDARSLEVCFAADALGADLPWLVPLELPLVEGKGVEDFVDSLAPRVVTEPAVADASPLKALLQVVLNAVLYATSAGVTAELREAPPQRRSKRGNRGPAPQVSSDSVYFLPGAIEISQVRSLQRLEQVGGGREVLRRFMVRGHWRRAAAGWADQRLRWVRPYWKGPDLAAVIERTYRLKE